MIPETTHQMPAPIVRDPAPGVSPAATSMVERPTPTPIILSIIWNTKAITAPANTAPQEISFTIMVRTSSAGATALTLGEFRDSFERGTSDELAILSAFY